MFRHWDEWRVGVRHHVFVADASGRDEPVDVTPGDFDSPPHFYEDGGIAFSPDGKELAFVSNREGGDREAWTTNKDVWIVPVTGGEAKEDHDFQRRSGRRRRCSHRMASRSPSARSGGPDASRTGGPSTSTIAPPARSARCSKRLTLSVGEYAFAQDGKSIWFTAAEKGTRTSSSSRPAAARRSGSRRGRDQLAARRARRGRVREVDPQRRATLALSTGARATRQLTRENASWSKDVAWPTPESLTVRGPAGRQFSIGC